MFNLYMFLFWMFPYTLGTINLFRNIKLNYYISSISTLLMFFTLWLADGKFSDTVLMILVVFFSAMISGSYYSTNNILITNYAKTKSELDRFISLDGFTNVSLNLCVPIVNSILIYFINYKASFIMMIIISLFFFYFTFKIKHIEVGDIKDFKAQFFKANFINKMICFMTTTICGVQSITMVGTILLFLLSANEIELALWNILVVFILLFLNMILKIFSNFTYNNWLIVLTLFSIIGMLLSLLDVSLIILFLLQPIILYLARFLTTSVPMNTIKSTEKTEQVILMYKREFLLVISRIIILLLTIYLVNNFSTDILFKLLFIINAISIFISTFFIKKISN